jgi:hypothetical protein
MEPEVVDARDVEEEDTIGHIKGSMTLVSSVTAPERPNRPPVEEAPVVIVTESEARMTPTKDVPVPNVAEDPTCHQTCA